jgi:acyl carrier protein phosphodiesterase
MAEKRLTRPNGLAGSAADLEGCYREFEQDFLAFFPDARVFASAFRRNRPRSPGSDRDTA